MAVVISLSGPGPCMYIGHSGYHLKPSGAKCLQILLLDEASVECIDVVYEVLQVLKGDWRCEGGTMKGFKLRNMCVQRRMIILYFVGMLRSDAGTHGASEISKRLYIISANLCNHSRWPYYTINKGDTLTVYGLQSVCSIVAYSMAPHSASDRITRIAHSS